MAVRLSSLAMEQQFGASVAASEIARFAALAGSFWETDGPFSMLHKLAPLRKAYVLEQVRAHFSGARQEENRALRGLSILDIGCGGGLLSEMMASCGGSVVGVDAAPAMIEAAKAHAAENGFSIDYRVGSAEALLAAKKKRRFDLITGLEIVEHVADLPSFMEAVAGLLKPGGLLILSSVNKTRRGFLLGIVAAEYLLGWVPPGTHDWEKFQPPSALIALGKQKGLEPENVTGMVFNPFKRAFVLVPHRTSVNYFLSLSTPK